MKLDGVFFIGSKFLTPFIHKGFLTFCPLILLY